MESYKKFKQFMANVESVSETLTKERDILLRQQEVFKNERFASDLMEDKERMHKANQGLVLIQAKLNDVDKKLSNLDIIPYAQAVYDECQDVIGQLTKELSRQFDIVLEARKAYLKEINKLALIRQKSQSIHNMTAECGRFVRRNPLDPLPIREFHRFIVDLKLLQAILK